VPCRALRVRASGAQSRKIQGGDEASAPGLLFYHKRHRRYHRTAFVDGPTVPADDEPRSQRLTVRRGTTPKVSQTAASSGCLETRTRQVTAH